LEGHVGEKGWRSTWLTKLGLTKKNPTCFPNRLLEYT
jgi:hypothetical protein